MNDLQFLPVGGALYYTPDFSSDIPATATCTAIAFTVQPVGSLTLSDQVDNLASGQSSIKVSGASHGLNYTLKATATLDNGETLVKNIGLRGYNG